MKVQEATQAKRRPRRHPPPRADDIKNIVGEYGALSDDYVNSFYCPEAFTRSVWETALRRMEEGDPTYMTQWKAAQQGSSPAGHHASQ